MTTLFSCALLLTLISVGIGGGYAQSPIDNYGISLPNYTGQELPIPDVFPDDVPVPDFTPDYIQGTVGGLPDGGVAQQLCGHNARSGGVLLDEAARVLCPSDNRAQYPNLAEMLDVVSAYLLNEDYQSADALSAQVGGAGIGNLQAAWQGRVERHLRALRRHQPCVLAALRREPGTAEAPLEPYKPCILWVNGELDHYRLKGEVHTPGYRLRSYGGTIGGAWSVGGSLTLGIALSGGHGKLTSDGGYTDLRGDMDCAFMSAFALWQSGRWQHGISCCIGVADVNFDRNVYMPIGYAAHGSTDGVGAGICYELSRDYVIFAEGGDSMSWHPFADVSCIFSRLASCSERGGDAALQIDDMTRSNAFFGLGVRLRNVFENSGFGAPFVVDVRLQTRAVLGSRRGKAEVALPGVDYAVTTHGVDPGAISGELGIGLSLPLRREQGALFADCAVIRGRESVSIGGVAGYCYRF